MFRPSVAALLTLTLAILPKTAQACAVCFADPDSAQGKALNAAVWTLMGTTTVMLTGVGAFIASIIIRTRAAAKEDTQNA